MKNQLNVLIEEACAQGLVKRVYPGVSAAVSVRQHGSYKRGVFSGGTTQKGCHGRPVTTSTSFDLASLTKPLCTTLCTLALIDSGAMQWHESCLAMMADTVPPEKQKITCHNILHHSTGFPAYHPYFTRFAPVASRENKALVRDLILIEPLVYTPETRCLYSDLGFIVLGQVIEQLVGTTLDQFYRTTILSPLQLEHILTFLPLDAELALNKAHTAATEQCGWRNKVMHGEVHDEHCWLVGGVSGHAGLFGTVEGVLSLCEWLLDCWHGRAHHPVIAPELLRYAVEWEDGENSWRLGFDSPTLGQSSSGRYLSPRSVGHLGFTGTSFWIDPEQDIVVVLLTNRVHPTRDNVRIRAFRPWFHDHLMRGIRRIR